MISELQAPTNVENKLEDIGFYTLSEHRARHASGCSPMWRCELLVTQRCNFRCSYCRPMGYIGDDTPLATAMQTLAYWIDDGLQNVRFSGGEPTLHPGLAQMVAYCKGRGVRRVAVSTNGSQPLELYLQLIAAGVDDMSVSLDACCAGDVDIMSGTGGYGDTVLANIRELARRVYTTVGVVITPDNHASLGDTVAWAHDAGVADIRVVPAAQNSMIVDALGAIEDDVIADHPILRYRVLNTRNGRGVRGLSPDDSSQCYLCMDDSVIAGGLHYPCVIYMREGGKPIGSVGPDMRKERCRWHSTHDCHSDSICCHNCLDVCIDYNNTAKRYCDTSEVLNGKKPAGDARLEEAIKNEGAA